MFYTSRVWCILAFFYLFLLLKFYCMWKYNSLRWFQFWFTVYLRLGEKSCMPTSQLMFIVYDCSKITINSFIFLKCADDMSSWVQSKSSFINIFYLYVWSKLFAICILRRASFSVPWVGRVSVGVGVGDRENTEKYWSFANAVFPQSRLYLNSSRRFLIPRKNRLLQMIFSWICQHLT